MANIHYLLMSLLVLGSSVGDGGLACSAALTILCLYVAHPIGGFLTVCDGVFSKEGLKLDLSVFNMPSLNQKNYTSNVIHHICYKIHNTCPIIYFAVLLLLLPLFGALLLHMWDL